MAKRKTSAQTRVKLKQAARKRRRTPKGSHYGGQFISGLISGGAHRHYAMGANPEEHPGGKPPRQKRGPVEYDIQQRISSPYPGATSNELFQQHYANRKRWLQGKGLKEGDAHQAAVSDAVHYAFARTGVMPDLGLVGLPPRVTHRDSSSDEKTAARVLAGMAGPGPRETTGELFKRLPKDEQEELGRSNTKLRQQLSQGLTDVGSSQRSHRYTSPGERDRQEKYIRARSQGATREQAVEVALADRRGRKPRESAGGDQLGKNFVAGNVTASQLQEYTKDRKVRMGRRSKTQSMAPRPGELTFGVRIPNVATISDLEKKFPGLSEADYVRLQESQRENIFDEFAKNQAWAHETRLAKMQGQIGRRSEGPNRLTIFTTSLGHPNVSVPSDSLIGQYVIRRRKNTLSKEKIASGAQLRGKFPEAVRDMHVVEASTGLSLGAEGNWGIFHKTGWRAGPKRSTGYGKPMPFGSNILRDSTGQPIYDNNGNVVYTEGATRRFRIGTPKEAGLGIYIG